MSSASKQKNKEDLLKKSEYNINYDLGNLFIFDTKGFEGEVFEEDIVDRAKSNLQAFYTELFKLKAKNAGASDENLNYDMPEYYLKLPEGTTLLPRAKPIPKMDKVMTRWEKFRKERGLPTQKKRTRLVFSEVAGDYVPRWGKGRYIS